MINAGKCLIFCIENRTGTGAGAFPENCKKMI